MKGKEKEYVHVLYHLIYEVGYGLYTTTELFLELFALRWRREAQTRSFKLSLGKYYLFKHKVGKYYECQLRSIIP